MQDTFLKYLWILPLIAVLQSCNLKDADKIEGPLTYNPTISVPIGESNTNFEEIFSTMDLFQTDTISGIDSIHLIWFENIFYHDSIGYYDTTFVTNFNFSFLSNPQENIKSIMFRINYMCELPCISTMQLYFEDAAATILDSLFVDGPFLIAAADTNADGFVESAEQKQTDVYFDTNKINMLQQVSRLELNFRIFTWRPGYAYYKFLARYRIYLQSGVRVELEDDL